MDQFSALADLTRRRIFEMLAHNGQLAASEISHEFDSSAPAISQHLKVLREANLVVMEKRGQQRIYSINPAALDEMWNWLNNMRQFWNDRFDVLEKLLKEEKKK